MKEDEEFDPETTGQVVAMASVGDDVSKHVIQKTRKARSFHSLLQEKLTKIPSNYPPKS